MAKLLFHGIIWRSKDIRLDENILVLAVFDGMIVSDLF
jgi:hypothetical protein